MTSSRPTSITLNASAIGTPTSSSTPSVTSTHGRCDVGSGTGTSSDEEYYLPDLPLYEVMSFADATQLRSYREVSLSFCEMEGSQRIWLNLAKHTLPPVLAAYGESPAFSSAPTAQARYGAVVRSRQTLRGIRHTRVPRYIPGKQEPSLSSPSSSGPLVNVDVTPKMLHLTFSLGPLFCASAVRGPGGVPAFLAARGSGNASLVVIVPRKKRSFTCPP